MTEMSEGKGRDRKQWDRTTKTGLTPRLLVTVGQTRLGLGPVHSQGNQQEQQLCVSLHYTRIVYFIEKRLKNVFTVSVFTLITQTDRLFQ